MSMDEDDVDPDRLRGRIAKLELAIMRHREATGHQMCWENDRELWAVLGEPVGDRVPPPLPDFMGRCAAYWLTRQRDGALCPPDPAADPVQDARSDSSMKSRTP